MSLNSRISKLELLTIKENKELPYNFSILSYEELKYMVAIPINQWRTNKKCIKIFKKLFIKNSMTYEEINQELVKYK